jgi:hypothetical protein
LGVISQMSYRATRGVRLLVAAALIWIGLAVCAHSAFAWDARVQVAKVNQGGNPNDSFAFHPSFTPTASDFSLKGGQTSTAFDVYCNVDRIDYGRECTGDGGDKVTLSVTERPTTGYTLTDITCRYTQGAGRFGGQPGPNSPIKPAGEVTKDLANGTVTLKAHYYEWVLCTYTNTYTPPTTPPTTTPPTTTPPATTTTTAPATVPVEQAAQSSQPQVVVSPSRARPGTALLRGPSGCARSDVVAASVTGKRIATVSFYVDNKKVKTLHQPNRGSRWVLSMRMRRLAFGTHRVRARVVFARSSRTRTKTLPLSFSRCRSAAARPQFTG